MVISQGLWQSQFGGDPAVLGRTVNLNGAPYTIIGVMPATFHFPTREVQLWTPLRFREEDFENRTNSYIEAVGRLNPGVTFEQARAELTSIAARLAREYPDTNEETGISFFRMRDNMSPRFRVMLFGVERRQPVPAAPHLRQSCQPAAGARERRASASSRCARRSARARNDWCGS